MANKPHNTLATKSIKVAGNRVLQYYLAKATETGLYGNNPTAAAGILLSRSIEDLIARGIIERASPETLDKLKNKLKP